MDSTKTTPQLFEVSRDIQSQLVLCRVDELRPHSAYVRHHLTVSAFKLSALAERRELAFREPLAITKDRTILDGYARWELARIQGRLTLSCIEYQLSDAEALQQILHNHRRSNGLNDFSRILLALELEPWLQAKARSNQQAGGRKKGSSNLTDLDRLDVRREVAAAAGVATGNVTKVKRLMLTAHPDILQALRNGEIRIHRAWRWSVRPQEEQQEEIRTYQSEKGVKGAIRTLLAQHRSKSPPMLCDIGTLASRLSSFESSKIGPVRLATIKASGRAVFITEELFRAMGLQEELTPICSTNNP